jgi:hypothetical protein
MQTCSFLGKCRKAQSLQPSAQIGDVARPWSRAGELTRQLCWRKGRL